MAGTLKVDTFFAYEPDAARRVPFPRALTEVAVAGSEHTWSQQSLTTTAENIVLNEVSSAFAIIVANRGANAIIISTSADVDVVQINVGDPPWTWRMGSGFGTPKARASAGASLLEFMAVDA